jgi:hypothetical protein
VHRGLGISLPFPASLQNQHKVSALKSMICVFVKRKILLQARLNFFLIPMTPVFVVCLSVAIQLTFSID